MAESKYELVWIGLLLKSIYSSWVCCHVIVTVCVCLCVCAFVSWTQRVCSVTIMQIVSRWSPLVPTLWDRERKLVFLCHVLNPPQHWNHFIIMRTEHVFLVFAVHELISAETLSPDWDKLVATGSQHAKGSRRRGGEEKGGGSSLGFVWFYLTALACLDLLLDLVLTVLVLSLYITRDELSNVGLACLKMVHESRLRARDLLVSSWDINKT